MPGNWITKQQVRKYMSSRKEGYTQETSALKAGISERSGRKIEQGKWSDARDRKRNYATRKDPLANVWDTECVPLLENTPALQAITLLEHLQEKHKNSEGEAIYSDSILRTLQRRVKQWKAVHGPAKEVMFRQEHEPGRLGLSDFTVLKEVKITIAGKELNHLLYHFRLAYSGFSHIKVVLGGESYSALAQGLQEALWRLGGSPLEHRTDSLSAAFKNLSSDARQDISTRYQEFCEHYQMKASRNNPGASHENGSIESPHGHLKRRIKQALILRGSNDFASVEDYQQWLDGVVNQHNRRNAKAFGVEREALQPLPVHKAADYTQVIAKVTSSSTIDVRKVTYSVPSRLQGETLQVRLYHDLLICYLGRLEVCRLSRVYPTGKTTRARQIDYRHVIHSLVKKPQAFRYSRLRNELLPTSVYRDIWLQVDEQMESRQACKFIVGLLHLAASNDCELALGEKVMAQITKGQQLSLTALQDQFTPKADVPEPEVIQHILSSYDNLVKEVRYG